MTADSEGHITPKAKAREQSSTLLGVAAFLQNMANNPNFGPSDLQELARGFQRLALRINRGDTSLTETRIGPSLRAVNINSQDLEPPQPTS